MFKVATWNVNSIAMRLERVLTFLKRESPDVLCLQELKCVQERYPKDAFTAAGYYSSVWGQKTYNGVAILSREKPLDVAVGFGKPPAAEEAARLIAATCSGVRVISAYCPNGQSVGSEKYGYKMNWFAQLVEHLGKGSNARTIVAGDFNVAPEDRDVHDPELWRGKILCSDLEREQIKRLTALGFQDTFRKHHEEGGLFSWWDYRDLGFPKNKGLRIDLILAGEELAEKCRAARIDREERKGVKPSDHAPVIAEFDL